MIKRLLISTLFLGSTASASELPIVTDTSMTIGAAFSRTFVSSTTLNKIPHKIRSSAKAVAQFGRGTAFYIGEKDNHHFMSTAAHTALAGLSRFAPSDRQKILEDPLNLCRVFPGDKSSDFKEFHLGILNIYVGCKKLVFLDEAHDTAIFEIETYGQALPNPINPSSSTPRLKFGEQLGFLSYSMHQNKGTNGRFDLVFSTDEDCRLFSEDYSDQVSSFSLIEDAPIKHTVFAAGCDFVGGDSGGPVFNLSTGALVGTVFGRRPHGLRSIGESSRSLFENFVELPKPQRVLIRNRHLNFFSPVRTKVFTLVN